jgi:cytochrome c peroxidase
MGGFHIHLGCGRRRRPDENRAENKPRARQQPDIKSCAVSAVGDYLAQHPDWLKAQLKRNIENDVERGWQCHLLSLSLDRLKGHAENCAHWTATYGEPLFGKDAQEWTRIVDTMEEFRKSIAAACGLGETIKALRAA